MKLTVKTIDSNNFEFEVEDNICVKDFKEQIAPKVLITPDLQRLIFCGRVLADDKTLKDYEINDGKVVHLVKRAPPASTGNRAQSNPNSAQASPRHSHNGRRFTGRANDDNSYLVGATFTIPQEALNPNGFQNMLQSLVQNMGDFGRNATVMSRTSEDGSSVDVQINLAQSPPQNEGRQRLSYIQRFIGYVNAIVDVIERPDSIPGLNDNANVPNGTFTVDANNMGSLESQLEAQLAASVAAAAQSVAFGTPFVSPPVFNGQTPRNTQNTSTQPREQSQTRSDNQSSANTTTTQSNRNQPVTASEINEVMNSAFRAEERLRPHVRRYQELLASTDRLNEQQLAEAQSLQRSCRRATHHLAHLFHLMSDFSVNFSTRTAGVVHTSHTSMESVSLSMPFAPQANNSNQSQSDGSTSTNASAPPPQTPHSDVNTAGSTTQYTNSVPRFAQSYSGDQSTSVYTTHSPIVVMEVGSTVERMRIPTSNANSNQTDQTSQRPPMPMRPLFIPPFDPYLQCNSPFTIPELRTRVSVGISTGHNTRQPTQSQNNQNQSNNNNENNENRNENQPQNMPFGSWDQIINGIITVINGSGLLGPASNQAANTAPNTAPAPTSTPTSTPNESSVNLDPSLIDLMGRLNNERSASESSDGEDQNDANMTDMIRSLVNRIRGFISDGQTQPINVANFLSQLEGFSYVEGENIANDVFMVMARHLTFLDFQDIFAGNPEPLSRVREPLRQYVEVSLLNRNESTNENIENAITSIIASWRPGLEMMTTGLSLLPGINLMATLEHFLRFNLNAIIRLFVFPPETDYGNAFFEIIRQFLVDLISLSRVVFSDGVLALQRMVGAFIEHISSEFNPGVQDWIRSQAIRHLNEYINNNNSEQSNNVETHVVRSDSESSNSTLNVNDNREVSNDVDSLEADNAEFIDAESDFDDSVVINGQPMEETSAQTTNQVQYELPRVLVGSESWHSSVPSDWVPIISSDLQRQRRMPLQRPYSDAYLTNVSKKRKIEKKPINLRDSLRNAITSAGVRPIVQTRNEDVADQIVDNSALNYSFDNIVRSAVTERMVTDDDYCRIRKQNPDRFANSSHYFTGKP